MAKRRTSYVPKAFESNGAKSDTSANIYMSMLMSTAFMELNPRQKTLYLYCKAQQYAEKHTEEQEQFTMNRSKWNNLYHLYSNGNSGSFYKDMSRLIEVGLVDCVSCGADSRQKSIYRLSSRWHEFGTDAYVLPEQVKTIALRGTRKRDKT